ncbi:hypothetical protein FHR24_001493 [Wenyingzhuangia heitensis]|uniref:Uncharacterized protein n=1 Tax=Wenyingzhuangia heitensis TaxID=1487859 RepID=A0ABX0U9M2_9FLAO|nr:hypothetical protein [Wenyingzhuangia heitensis]NIJ45054.1 hypothetical protein [Wenyingzhuangia heitensis]
MLETFLYPVIASFLTALTTWGFAKGKTKQQIRALQIENDEKSAKYYQGLVDDLAVRLKKALDQLQDLDQKYRGLLNDHQEVLSINKELIDELRKYKQLRKEPIKT